MYFDNLTITAIIVIAIAVGLFIRNCLLRDCGSTCESVDDCDTGTRHYKL
ncbi:MAG: hypothetical protein PVF08_01875 [Gammaproteobacteria bacterium]|jgi:hypothetical protein